MATQEELLRQQYQTSLGREASDDEIAGWTSGKFGGGGVDQWLNQISTSHEAGQHHAQPLSSQANPGAVYNNAPSAPTSNNAFNTFMNSDRSKGTADQILRNAYTDFLGRDADLAGLQSHYGNPYGLQGAVSSIYASPEAQEYRRKQLTAPAASTDPASATTATATVTPQILNGFTPKYAMEGFDFNRQQDTGKSAKDGFAFLANNAPPPPTGDKAALAQWFTQYVAPGMNQLGHKIISVDGDTFTFENWQGRFTVDYARGAGAPGAALAWQVQEDSAKPSNGTYTPKAATSTAGTTTPTTAPTAPTTTTPDGTIPPEAQTNAPTNVTPMPMSSTLIYRRPYQGYEEDAGIVPI